MVGLATACDPGSLIAMAGNGSSGNSGDAGAAHDATLTDPGSVAAIPGGGFYVVDHATCTIRQVDSSNTISTVAGTGTCGTSGNGGPATAAEIAPTAADSKSFQSIAVTADGTLYLADTGSATVRRLSGGVITEAGSQAGCSTKGVVTGPDDRVYVNCGYTIGRLETDGSITTMVSPSSVPEFSAFAVTSPTTFLVALGSDSSTSIVSLSGSGDGATTGGAFWGYGASISAMAADSSGNVYLSAPDDGIIARIPADASGVDSIAGNGTQDPATTAQSGVANNLPLTPNGIAFTPNHGLLFSSGHVVYRLEGPTVAPAASPVLPPDTTTTTTIGQG